RCLYEIPPSSYLTSAQLFASNADDDQRDDLCGAAASPSLTLSSCGNPSVGRDADGADQRADQRAAAPARPGCASREAGAESHQARPQAVGVVARADRALPPGGAALTGRLVPRFDTLVP